MMPLRDKAMFLTGSVNNANISELRDGDIQPIIALGDRVPGGTAFFTGANTAVVQRIASGACL